VRTAEPLDAINDVPAVEPLPPDYAISRRRKPFFGGRSNVFPKLTASRSSFSTASTSPLSASRRNWNSQKTP